MEIVIKPFEEKYTVQCADLEKYLWKEDADMRLKRFKWTYLDSPNYHSNLSVIAVNENDEVMGFRGLFVNKFKVLGEDVVVAQIADTIVSPKARRMGIFNKMNVFAFKQLEKENVSFILDTGPSWPPYYGYKKLGFEDLAPFHNVYKYYVGRIIARKLGVSKKITNEIMEERRGLRYYVTTQISDELLYKIEGSDNSDKIHSSVDFDNLKWRSQKPNKKYVYAYTLDSDNNIESFIMFSTVDFEFFSLGLLIGNNVDAFRYSMKLFEKVCNPTKVMAWDFAINDLHRYILSKLRFYPIPFLSKFRKNPPALVYSVQLNEEGYRNWIINGIDIRDINNWNLSRIDMDSY